MLSHNGPAGLARRRHILHGKGSACSSRSAATWRPAAGLLSYLADLGSLVSGVLDVFRRIPLTGRTGVEPMAASGTWKNRHMQPMQVSPVHTHYLAVRCEHAHCMQFDILGSADQGMSPLSTKDLAGHTQDCLCTCCSMSAVLAGS